MALFEKELEEIREELRKISASVSATLRTEFDALKQESIDFSNLMRIHSIYIAHRQALFANPSMERFRLVEHWWSELKKSFEKINKETHNLEHMLNWMRTQMKFEEQVVHQIQIKSIKVK